MDRGSWWATVRGVAESRTRLRDSAHPWCHIEEITTKSSVMKLWSCFSSKSFVALALMFKSLSCFELISLYNVRYRI